MGTHATITFTDGKDKAHIHVSSNGDQLSDDVEKFMAEFNQQEHVSNMGARYGDVGLTAARFLVYLAGEFAKTSVDLPSFNEDNTLIPRAERRKISAKIAKNNPLIFGSVRIVADPRKWGASHRFVVECSDGGLIVREVGNPKSKKILIGA